MASRAVPGCKALFLTDFQGLTVGEMNDLTVRVEGSRRVSFKVLKNTLVRLAYKDTDVECFGTRSGGARAAVWTHSDEMFRHWQRFLVDFAKTHPNLGLVTGELQSQLFDPSDLETLVEAPIEGRTSEPIVGDHDGAHQRLCQHTGCGAQVVSQRLKAIEEKKAESGSCGGYSAGTIL